MIMIMNKPVDMFVAIDSNEIVKVLNLNLTNIPIPTGIAVIRNIVMPKDIKFKGGASVPIKYCIERPVIKGSVIIVTILTTAVYEIDKAVSPLASLVIIFEVTPPGHEANIIIPTANSLVMPIKDTMKNAVIGSKNNVVNHAFLCPAVASVSVFFTFSQMQNFLDQNRKSIVLELFLAS